MLAVYTALRPRRATAVELEVIAQHLADVAAPRCAAFVREAAIAMAERGLLRVSERFRVRAAAPLRRETLIRPEPSLGLVAMNGPGDPEPSLVIEDGAVSELDGKPRERFDTLDRFIADYRLGGFMG